MSSHRHLVHRHMRRLLSKKPRDLLPGEVRFFSFYQPSLQGGIHTIEVCQDVTLPDSDPEKPEQIATDSQAFNVIAPRYNLPAGVVDSVYPQPGASAAVTILPHIVFKDPHMPWERDPTFVDHTVEDKDARNLTPWLLLLVFTPDELRLEEKQLTDALHRLPDVKTIKQNETMAVRMRVRETPLLDNVVNAIPFHEENDAHDAEGPVDVVFLRKELFVSLFTDPVAKTKTGTLDVSQYKYLAHVRQVAIDGMAVAGKPGAGEDDKESELFSLVVAPRCGPLGLKVPTTTVVHLVSLNTKKDLTLSSDSDRVALVSLYSWTYNCLPSEGDASPRAQLQHLGANMTVLHPQMPDEDKQKKTLVSDGASPTDPLDDIISQRQRDGYTLVKHRTITGETTAAIIRGPFAPKLVPHPLREKDFTIQSNFGTDLQILDPKLSLMDITYSSAWQLGKTLAMGDQAFSASLARLRGAIYAAALDRSKVDVRSALGAYQSRGDTVSGMSDLVRGLNVLNQALFEHGEHATATIGANRWDYSHPAASASSNSTSHHVDVSMRSPHISTRVAAHAHAAALSLATASDDSLYNEHQAANSPDFAHVYSWVLDKLHLANVPAHYLLPDPSYLPQETLRLFYVDENWTDALVDGALSLANHWGATPVEDFCRTAIKAVINKRLTTPDASLGGWHVQMPKYGFLLRSQLLVLFPDITVSVEFAETRTTTAEGEPEAPKAPILVQKRLSADTMYCLFDCLPPDIEAITFTMPPHQQRFTIGSAISEEELTVSYKKIYTQPDPQKRHDKDNKTPIGKETFPLQAGEVFDLGSRTLKVRPYLDKVHDAIWNNLDRDDFSDKAKTSALLALQLNESIPELRIAMPKLPSTSSAGSRQATDTFQFALPPTRDVPPPAVEPLPRRLDTTPTTRITRPRPASPRREAALIAQRALTHKNHHPVPVLPRTPRLNPSKGGVSSPTTTADLPKWDLDVYPVRSRAFVPSDGRLPISLVVKIVRSPDSLVPDLPLLWIEVALPWGDMPPHPGGDDSDGPIPLLARDADPPVPAMLSNLRFNVLKYYATKAAAGAGGGDKKDRGTVNVRVVPRSSRGVIIDRVAEASFLLSRAQIAWYAGTEPRSAEVKVRFAYANPEGGEPTVISQSVYVKLRAAG